MTEALIVEQDDFEELCDHLRDAGLVAFDTEFVSEDTFRPELCLLQMATSQRCVAVDPYCVADLSSWWALMTDDRTTVVVHAGREEIRFCLTHTGQPPQRLVDIQLAEGLKSRSYPLSYDGLVNRVLNVKLHHKETRTDWRRRPLAKKQIEYALDDVRYVLAIWREQSRSLESLGRMSWAEAEFKRMIEEVQAERTGENWRRLSGIHKLKPRELAVARELFYWREEEASKRNKPARRVLRDDLLLEVARRQPRSQSDVLSTRDMNRSTYKRVIPQLLEGVRRGLEVPESELPARAPKRETNADDHVLGKLLAVALANRCAEAGVSMNLVGTTADLRELVRWHVDRGQTGQQPRLAQGWRAEVCGNLLENVLDGKVSLRVADPESDHPLVFEEGGFTDL